MAAPARGSTGSRENYAAVRDAPALCEHVGSGPDARTRRACYHDALGQARADPHIKARRLVASDCTNILSSTHEQRCWTLLALAQNDASHCARLSPVDAADDCWFGAGTRDANHCLHIDSSSRRADCALKYWPTSSATPVCAELAPDELKRACIRHAEAKKASH